MKRFKQIFTNQRNIFWIFLFMLILPNCIMFFTESTSLFTRVIQVLLPLGFYATALTMARKPGKAFWWLFIFMFFAAFEIVLLRLYGETPIAVDMFLNVVTTNPGEATELLSNLLVVTLFVIGLYGFGIALSIVSLRIKETLSDKFRIMQRRWSFPVLLLGLALLVVNCFADRAFRVQDDIFPVNVSYNLGLSVQRVVKSSKYKETSKSFTYNASSTRPDSLPEIYVLVVGETSRADNWHLYGYERNTTPYLSALNDIVVYRDALTMSNTTHKSVPMLMSGVATEHYDSLYYRKGVITAFREAGFQTAFFSNQQRNHSFIDAFGSEAHEVKFLKDKVLLMGNIFDDKLVSCVKKRLDSYNGGKLLIVVHMYGSHFNYKDRYPKQDVHFKPDNVISAEKIYRKALINAYDNSIVNTDRVIASIIKLVDSKGVNSAVLFTSDHGEDIFDDDRGRFLHASPLPTYYQLRVPLLVWTSRGFGENYPQLISQLESHSNMPVSTNMVMFHTLLDLGGINTQYKNESLSLCNPLFKAHRRLYINDHNEFKTLDSCGLKKQDILMFKKNKLKFP